jgi:FixJ family two-component response regulator
MSDDAPLVAVVDDEASICRALLRLLRSANYRATAFSSAPDFLASLGRETPDCLVLDLQMPIMTGFELQEQLKRHAHAPPVIIITSHDEPGTRDRCLALGAVRYLRKPIEGNTLITSIQAIVAERTRAREGSSSSPARETP